MNPTNDHKASHNKNVLKVVTKMHIDSEIKVSPPYHCQFSEDRVSDQFISNGFMCTLFFF